MNSILVHNCLRSFGSKTYQTFLPLFNQVPYKFVATATPSPNRFKELIHYAGFLGIMDTGQALTRFFKRDSSKAGNLQIHPHKLKEFQLWLSTWAVFVQTPSDLGYSDEGYVLPPLEIHRHRLPVDHASAGYDSWGQGKLLRNAATSLSDAAKEKRDSLGIRTFRLKEIINGIRQSGISETVSGKEQGHPNGKEENKGPGGLSGEPREIQSQKQKMERGKSGTVQGSDEAVPVGQSREGNGGKQEMVCGTQGPSQALKPSEEVEGLRSHSRDLSGTSGEAKWNLPDLPRNYADSGSGPQSPNRSSAGASVPTVQCGNRAIQGQPGNASAGDSLPQFIVWCELNDEQRAVEKLLDGMGVSYTSLDGSMSIESREEQLEHWLNRDTVALVTKPVMYGYGANLQQCHISIFFGIGYKFSDLVQAIARTQRFGQEHTVDVHLIYTESEDPIYDALMVKWKQHEELQGSMSKIIRECGLNQIKAGAEMQRSIGVPRQEVKGSLFTAVCNDNVMELQGLECVDPESTRRVQHLITVAGQNGDKLKVSPSDLGIRTGAHRFADNSVDLIVTSVPFSDAYEYTETYNDFGHNDGDKGFFEQMDFLTPELIRALRPGRLYCVHAKDRIVYGSVSGDGMYTVNPFSDKCVAHLIRHGLRYCGRITVVTDVVRENNQTYRLGWTENSKDGTKMGVGSPEYILLFRKLPTDTTRAYADVPVVKSKTDYTRARWQFDAHSMWRSNGNRFLRPEDLGSIPMDKLRKLWHQYSASHVYDYQEHVSLAEEMEARGILPSTFMALDPPNPNSPWVWDDVARMRTLNSEQVRKNLTMHICPLQLDICERLIERYSNPGDLVLDPFGGVGSVAYCAVSMGRKAFTIELNEQYHRDAVGYCRAAEMKASMPTLFDLEPIQPEIET